MLIGTATNSPMMLPCVFLCANRSSAAVRKELNKLHIRRTMHEMGVLGDRVIECELPIDRISRQRRKLLS